VVAAPVRGKVFNVAKFPGEYVRNSDVVLLMERDATPVVLIRVLSDEALKLKSGMPATVHMPSNGQNYEATVSAIGYASVSADATTTMEASLNETLVRLDFVDPNIRAPLNSRVRVYIRTF
jgi:multidrug resistance efflux pump